MFKKKKNSLGFLCFFLWNQVLTQSEQMRKEADDVGPKAELEHWKQRMARFNSLLDNIKSQKCKAVVGVLTATKSKLLKVSAEPSSSSSRVDRNSRLSLHVRQSWQTFSIVYFFAQRRDRSAQPSSLHQRWLRTWLVPSFPFVFSSISLVRKPAFLHCNPQCVHTSFGLLDLISAVQTLEPDIWKRQALCAVPGWLTLVEHRYLATPECFSRL